MILEQRVAPTRPRCLLRNSGSASKSRCVHDQNYTSIPKLCRASDAGNLDQGIVDRSYYDFALPEYAVNGDSDRACPLSNHKNLKCLTGFFFKIEQPRQPHKREDAAAMRDDFVVLKRLYRGRFYFDDFCDARLGDGEALSADRDDQGIGNRESQRQMNCESCPAAALGIQLERAAKPKHRILDHGHPDAAPGSAVCLIASRKTRHANQLKQRARVELRAGVDQSPRARASCHVLRINPSTVVFDLNHNQLACGKRAERQLALRRLSSGRTLGYGFKTVADGIANQVQDRVHHPLDQQLVDLRMLSAD